jgi:NAD+ diphosphatase
VTFIPAIVPPSVRHREAWWFLFHGDRLLVESRGDSVSIQRGPGPEAWGADADRTQYLGVLDGVPCFSGELADHGEPEEGMAFRSLRPLLGVLPEPLFALAGQAFQIMDWDRTHRFCGKCGGRTEPVEGERAMACPRCGIHFFPRVTPAVIVAVVRDGKILLAHARRFPSVFFSVLAGFVEPGETLEECVHREVREEVGIEVTNVSYFGSQPWPFPHSLMVAFTAEYAGGDLVLEEKEIAGAGWFEPAEVLKLQIPRPETIARRLIDWFLSRA